MKKHQIILSTILLALALGTCAARSAQDTPSVPNQKRSWIMLGLVRTINTAEVGELDKYGSYSSWPILLSHNEEPFNGLLNKRYYPDNPNMRFSDMPEIMPGFALRLNVQADGKGYVVLLIDQNDKTGFAAVSDESGIIRLCKFLE